MPLNYSCKQLAVLELDAPSAVEKGQQSALNVWQGTNFSNTVALKDSALTSLITWRIASGRVRNIARAAIILVKPAMGRRKISARLVVLMVLVGRHLIEFQSLANACVLHKWPKSMVFVTLSALWIWEHASIKNAWPHVPQTPTLCLSTMEQLLKNQLSLILQVKMLAKSTLITYSFLGQVWDCHFLDPKISRLCRINSRLLSGSYQGNWIQNHSLSTFSIEVISGVRVVVIEFSTSSLLDPMKTQTLCSQLTTLLVTATRSHWPSGLILVSARGKLRQLLPCTIKCSCQLWKATSEMRRV